MQQQQSKSRWRKKVAAGTESQKKIWCCVKIATTSCKYRKRTGTKNDIFRFGDGDDNDKYQNDDHNDELQLQQRQIKIISFPQFFWRFFWLSRPFYFYFYFFYQLYFILFLFLDLIFVLHNFNCHIMSIDDMYTCIRRYGRFGYINVLKVRVLPQNIKSSSPSRSRGLVTTRPESESPQMLICFFEGFFLWRASCGPEQNPLH